MKKIITILFCCVSLNSGAQLNSSIGVGYNSNNYPAYELKCGYELHRINFDAGFSRSLNRNSNTHIYSGGEIGINLFNEGDAYLLAKSVIVSAGYFYDKVNSDQKANLSACRPSISVKYIKLLKENAGLYAKIFYIKNTFELTGGLFLKFN